MDMLHDVINLIFNFFITTVQNFERPDFLFFELPTWTEQTDGLGAIKRNVAIGRRRNERL